MCMFPFMIMLAHVVLVWGRVCRLGKWTLCTPSIPCIIPEFLNFLNILKAGATSMPPDFANL